MSEAKTKDVVVVLPGIAGSVLQRDGEPVWDFSAGGIVKQLRRLRAAGETLVLDGDDGDPDAHPGGVRATRLMPHAQAIPGLWKIDVYGSLVDRLERRLGLVRGKDLFEFPYDWRRDNRVSALQLERAAAGWLERSPGARLVLLCHSMGGLVARYFVEVLEGWRDTRLLITFGTPFRGAPKALVYLVNGLRAPAGVVDVSDAVRTFPSVYQLLPTYPCLADARGELARLSEIDSLPRPLDPERVRAGGAFHADIRAAAARNARDDDYAGKFRYRPVVGTEQVTIQAARRAEDGVEAMHLHGDGDPGGDGTVPAPSATPIEIEGQDLELFVARAHSGVHTAPEVAVQVESRIRGIDYGRFRAVSQVALSLDLQDVYTTDEPVVVRARPDAEGRALEAVLAHAATGAPQAQGPLRRRDDGWQEFKATGLPEGDYRITVRGHGEGQPVDPVTDVLLVTAPR
ncbi:MAG: hypothetical protein M3340_19590 [Actinomycetota bacterium]|nr:hypothetical protein [Actinomycetota bacterium]